MGKIIVDCLLVLAVSSVLIFVVLLLTVSPFYFMLTEPVCNNCKWFACVKLRIIKKIVKSQSFLVEIAQGNVFEFAIEALKKIVDNEDIFLVARWAYSVEVQKEAIWKLNDDNLLKELFVTSKKVEIRTEAAKKLPVSVLISLNAMNDCSAEVRQVVNDKISVDNVY